MLKKKLSLILVGIALIAVTGIWALSQTWAEAKFMMHLTSSSSSGELKVFWDCEAKNPVIDIDWGKVTQGQRYIRSVFVLNTGTVKLMIYYLPTWVQNAQYKFHIECFVHSEGIPCQLNKIIPPPPLLEKTAYPAPSYELYPGCMIKVDIYLTIEMIEALKTYDFEFGFYGSY